MADQSDFQLLNATQAFEYAREAVKMCVTINGGAAVAIISFVGATSSETDTNGIQIALAIFSTGLLLAFLAFATGYTARIQFAAHIARGGEERTHKRAVVLSVVGFLLMGCSALAFTYGVYQAGQALFPTETKQQSTTGFLPNDMERFAETAPLSR